MLLATMTTLVLGASTNPDRYSFLAAKKLLAKGHDIVLLGNKAGTIDGHEIHTSLEPFEGIDTVTLYLGPKNQGPYFDYLLDVIRPRRIIFNPGTENDAFRQDAEAAGIQTEYACTLVLLGTDSYDQQSA